MIVNAFYTILLAAWFVIGAVTFVSLFFVCAPYGRHSRPGWGAGIQARFGWLIMEAVSPIFFCFFLFIGKGAANPAVLTFMGLWLLHYVNRAFIYPFRMRAGKKLMPVSVMFMAVFFNVINGYLNGGYLRFNSWAYDLRWLTGPRFIAGTVLFLSGFLINLHSDGILRRLRKGEDSAYAIPREGFFELVTGANYFGEILEWFGWACLTWSIAGLAFAFWAACNLIPRARSHHLWYLEKFPDYPRNRRVIFPYLY